MRLETLFFLRRKIRAQREGDSAREFRLQCEQIRNLAIIGVVPDVPVGARVDELCVDPHAVRFAPHRPLHHVGDAERFADLPQISRPGPVLPNRCAADHFQVRHFGETRDNVVLDPVRKVSVLLVVTQIFKGQNCDALFRQRRFRGRRRRRSLWNVVGAHDSAQRQVERPGKKKRDRKSENQHDDNEPHGPGRNFEERKDLRRDLNQQPGEDRVTYSDAINFPPLQLAKESRRVHGYRPNQYNVMAFRDSCR